MGDLRRALALVGLGALVLLALTLVAGSASATPCTMQVTSGTAGNGAWYRSAVTVSMDAGGLPLNWSIDNSTYTPYAAQVAVAGDGWRWVECRVSETDGSFSESAREVRVDATPPTNCVRTAVREAYASLLVTGGDGIWLSPTNGASQGVRDYLHGIDATSGVPQSAATISATVTASPGTTPIAPGPVATDAFGAFVRVWNEGHYTVSCTVADEAGNVGGPYAHTLGIDTTPPACTTAYPSSPNANGWLRLPGNLTLAASDARSGVWTTNATIDGASAPYVEPFPLPRGLSIVACEVRDRAGNAYTGPTQTFRFDDEPPAPCAISRVHDTGRGVDLSPVNGWYGASGLFFGVGAYLSSSDEHSGLEYYLDVVVDGGPPQSVGSNGQLTVHGEGAHAIDCTATDLAGNAATTPLALRLDTTAPTCSGAHTGELGANGWYTSGAFRLTAGDAASGVWRVDLTVGSTPRSTQFDPTAAAPVATVEVADEGNYFVSCVVTDASGLTSVLTRLEVRLDTARPMCSGAFTGASGSAGWHVQAGSVELTASAGRSGVSTVSYSLDGGPFRTYSAPVRIAADGVHVLRCRVTTPSGGVGEGELTVRLDATPPAPCAARARGAGGSTLLPSDGWYRERVDLTVSTADATSGVASLVVTLDGERMGTNATVAVLAVDEPGAHEVACVATDVAGNKPTEHALLVGIDHEAPVCDVRAGGTGGRGGWWLRDAWFDVAATDAGSGVRSVVSSLDGAAPTSDARVAVAGDGAHRLECVATDVAGNVGVESYDLRLDGTPPSCDVAFEGDGADRAYRPPVAARLAPRDATSGLASTQVSVDGAPFAPWDGSAIGLTDVGIHDLVCRVEDAAGNAADVPLGRVRLFDGVDVREDARLVLPAEEIRHVRSRDVPLGAWPALAALGAGLLARRRGPG